MHLHTFLVIYTSHLSCSKLRFTLVCSLDNFSFSLLYALIHTGRRRQCLSFTLNECCQVLPNWVVGSSLRWRCLQQKLKTFQAPTPASANQIALCKYPSADASQSCSCNTRKVCDWLSLGLGDISHAICMRISSVKPVPWLAVNLHQLFSNGA